MFYSDQLRAAYLKNPQEVSDRDDFSVPHRLFFNDDNDYVFVRQTPNYIVYFEKWLPECRKGWREKYGRSDNAHICAVFPPRLSEIAEFIGMKFISHEIVKGYSVAIFTS